MCGFLGFRFSISAAMAVEEELCKGDLECTFAQAASYITSQAETHTHTHIQLHFGAKAIGKCKSFFAN